MCRIADEAPGVQVETPDMPSLQTVDFGDFWCAAVCCCHQGLRSQCQMEREPDWGSLGGVHAIAKEPDQLGKKQMVQAQISDVEVNPKPCFLRR